MTQAPTTLRKDSYDAVVVGTGFGGAVASCRLAQAGIDVAVLERGRRYPPGSFPRHVAGRNSLPSLRQSAIRSATAGRIRAARVAGHAVTTSEAARGRARMTAKPAHGTMNGIGTSPKESDAIRS